MLACTSCAFNGSRAKRESRGALHRRVGCRFGHSRAEKLEFASQLLCGIKHLVPHFWGQGYLPIAFLGETKRLFKTHNGLLRAHLVREMFSAQMRLRLS